MVDCTVHTKSSATRGSAVQKQPCSLALPFVSFVPPLATQPTPLPIFSLSHLGSPLSSSPHQDIRVTASCLPGFKRPLSALSQFWSWFCSVYTNRNLCFQTLKSYVIWPCLFVFTFYHDPVLGDIQQQKSELEERIVAGNGGDGGGLMVWITPRAHFIAIRGQLRWTDMRLVGSDWSSHDIHICSGNLTHILQSWSFNKTRCKSQCFH